jgi:hypothetical protein
MHPRATARQATLHGPVAQRQSRRPITGRPRIVTVRVHQPSLAQRVKAAAPEPEGEGGHMHPRATARQATNTIVPLTGDQHEHSAQTGAARRRANQNFVSIGPRAYKAWIGRARDF